MGYSFESISMQCLVKHDVPIWNISAALALHSYEIIQTLQRYSNLTFGQHTTRW